VMAQSTSAHRTGWRPLLGDRRTSRAGTNGTWLLVDKASMSRDMHAINGGPSLVCPFMTNPFRAEAPLGFALLGLTQGSFEPLRKLDRVVVVAPEVHVDSRGMSMSHDCGWPSRRAVLRKVRATAFTSCRSRRSRR